jgi:GTP-binding protein HflX
VVDASSPHFEEQMQVVKETLKEIGAEDKPVLLVFNKVDAYHAPEDDFGEPTMTLQEFENSWIARENHPAVFVSAQKKENIQRLHSMIVDMVNQLRLSRRG